MLTKILKPNTPVFHETESGDAHESFCIYERLHNLGIVH